MSADAMSTGAMSADAMSADAMSADAMAANAMAADALAADALAADEVSRIGCQRGSIESMMQAEFRRSGYGPLRHVTFEFDNGVLSLFGQVPTFHLRQIALVLVRRRLANVRIDDRLQVG